jgi:hypothetical protein
MKKWTGYFQGAERGWGETEELHRVTLAKMKDPVFIRSARLPVNTAVKFNRPSLGPL